MKSAFNVGDLVKFTNFPMGLRVCHGKIGIVLEKSNRSFASDDSGKMAWAYKVKFIDVGERWEMEYSLELHGKVK